jgi:hypothetical protein
MKNETGEVRLKRVEIRISGPQDCGKTTVARAVREVLKRMGIRYRVIEVQDNAR